MLRLMLLRAVIHLSTLGALERGGLLAAGITTVRSRLRLGFVWGLARFHYETCSTLWGLEGKNLVAKLSGKGCFLEGLAGICRRGLQNMACTSNKLVFCFVSHFLQIL